MAAPSEEFLNPSVAALGAEVERVVHALRVGSIRDEEDFTSQMLAAIRAGLSRVMADGLEWDSAVLKKQAEEPKFGADFAGVLRMRLPGYDVDKGFLAQAKMAGPRKRISTARLLEQAKAMLRVSPASFVFLYRPAGVSVVPAVAVVANGGEPRDLHGWNLDEFFSEHFSSFVGDPKLGLSEDQTLRGFIEELPARQVLYMHTHRVGSQDTLE
jgi:hypothetical protein